jgi:hypothetical protein
MKLSNLIVLAAALALTGATAATAAPPAPLSRALSPLSFLVGSWNSQPGARLAQGGSATGAFDIQPAVGGAALIRRDHTVLLGPGGKRQTYEQIMLVYPDSGRLRADYFDGQHAIHYTDVTVDADGSVRFASDRVPGQPAYRLTYHKIDPRTVKVTFEIAPPGQDRFQALVEGSATRR